MSSKAYYYCEPDGDSKGPLPLGSIKAAIKAGRLHQETKVALPEGRWRSVSEVEWSYQPLEVGDTKYAGLPEETMEEELPHAYGTGLEYKVISQKDKWFSGRFDAKVLEKVLNQHARAGWRVISIASASREGFIAGGSKDELVVVLERGER